ncbi:MAG: chemotaxis protein CheB [Marinobacter sp.]
MKKKVNMSNSVSSNELSLLANADTPVVAGIRASAGGLEVLEDFFSNVLTHCKTLFFVIQHIDSAAKSIMPYRTQEDVADGVVITVIDISAAKELGNDLPALRSGK